MTIIAFIIIFSVVVIAHEFGHFILAKKNGIKVLEFAVGMGPALIKFQKGDTNYVLRLLPIGGACVYEGGDGIYDSEKGKEVEKPEGSFQDASVWARISVAAAGPLFNILLAFLLSLIVVGFSGYDKPIIKNVTEGGAADLAGIKVDDVITEINGGSIHLYREVALESYMSQGEPFSITYDRGNQEYETLVTPIFDEADQRYYMGFAGSELMKCQGFEIFEYAFYEVKYSLESTLKSLMMLVQGRVGKDDLAGPIGIAVIIDDTIESAAPYGFSVVVLSVIKFAILLSVNLGVLNLLPLPALDGGRLVFMFIEAIRGKPVAPEKEGMVHFIGFVALMVFMVFVVFNDISRLF